MRIASMIPTIPPEHRHDYSAWTGDICQRSVLVVVPLFQKRLTNHLTIVAESAE